MNAVIKSRTARFCGKMAMVAGRAKAKDKVQSKPLIGKCNRGYVFSILVLKRKYFNWKIVCLVTLFT